MCTRQEIDHEPPKKKAAKPVHYVCALCDFDAGADPLNLPRCPNCGSQHGFERVEVTGK